MLTEQEFKAQYYAERRAKRLKYSCRICGDIDATKRYIRERICKLCRSNLTKAWNRKYPGKARKIQFVYRLLWTYNIHPDRYMEMYRDQDGKCAVCFKRLPLQVDHDHRCCPGKKSCGKCVRGLVCGPHNRGLSSFGDNVLDLRSAADYLERAQTVPVL